MKKGIFKTIEGADLSQMKRQCAIISISEKELQIIEARYKKSKYAIEDYWKKIQQKEVNERSGSRSLSKLKRRNIPKSGQKISQFKSKKSSIYFKIKILLHY